MRRFWVNGDKVEKITILILSFFLLLYGVCFSIVPNKVLFFAAIFIIALSFIYNKKQKIDIRIFILINVFVIVSIEQWILGITDYSNILLLPVFLYWSMKCFEDIKPILGLIVGVGVQALIIIILEKNNNIYLAVGGGSYLDYSTLILFVCLLALVVAYIIGIFSRKQYITIGLSAVIIICYLYVFFDALDYDFSNWLLAQQRALVEIKNGEMFFGVFVFEVESTRCYFTEYASEYGYLVFGLVITFVILSIKDMITFLCDSEICLFNRTVIGSFYIAIYFNLIFTDDAMRTSIVMFLLLMVAGYVRSIVERNNTTL